MAKVRQQLLGHAWTKRRRVTPRVVSAAWCERAPWGRSRRIMHDLWVLDYSRSDCGRGRVGSPRARWWPRGPRVAHLYRPGTPFWEDNSDVRGPVREAWVLFVGGQHADLGHLLGTGVGFGRIADPGGRAEAHLSEIALAGQRLGEGGFWQAQSHLAALFDELRRAAPGADEGTFVLPAGEAEADAEAGLAEAVRAFFRDHLGEKITLSRLARHLGTSQSSLSHRYTELAGESPMAALAAMRMDAATSLLLRGMKLEAIARQLGYFDAFHFSKAFRKHRGVSPSRFRQQFR